MPGAETDGALGEPRGVIKDGALYPVDPTRGGFCFPVVVVGKTPVAALEFVGVPVARGAAQGLFFNKADRKSVV